MKQDALTLKFPSTQTYVWKYIGDTVISDIEWPLGVAASGSGVGCKAGYDCGPSASGFRPGWCFGTLNYGGLGGVACRSSYRAVGNASWSGALGAPGLNG